MTFPSVPRDVAVEMFLNGGWVNVTTDVRAADGIVITRGRPNEAGQAQPSTCSLTLANRSGNYSPRNPLGLYYGVLGRNTPIRVSVNTVRDTFSRTVSNNWGLTDTGHDWLHTWSSGGSVDDFDVAGGVGTQSILNPTQWRRTTLPDEVYRDVDVTVTATLPFANVTGGSISANLILRGQSTIDFYLIEYLVDTTEAVFLKLWSLVNGTFSLLTPVVQITDFVYSGQPLRLRAQAGGHFVRAKVWVASQPEPYGWHAQTFTDDINTAGWVGIRSDVYSGNTNTMPGVFAYDDLIVRSVRFAGEVSSWPQRWDVSGADITAPVEAASLLRRMSQGSASLLSTMYRGITGLTVPAVAYWPAEEGPAASSISSAVGGPPMILTGISDFAGYGEFASSFPIPVLGQGSSWTGAVPTYTGIGGLQLRFIAHFPDSGVADLAYLCEMTTGGGRTWSIRYHTGVPATGAISIQLWEYNTLLRDTGPVAFAVNGVDLAMDLAIEQNGSAIDWEFSVLKVGATQAGFVTDSQPSRTLQRALRVRVNPHAEVTGVAIGHVSVRKEAGDTFDLQDELNGFAGEFATVRMIRLCAQNDVALSYILDFAAGGTLVGPQRPLPLLTLLQEAADADLGTLCDTRGNSAILYRERASLYGQSPVVTLDYGGGQIAPPFQPVDDDQLTRNDVTVERLNGGSVRAVLETGRMSVLPPEQGGVGAYGTAVNVNVFRDGQLPDIAGWLMHLGTVDETRYPTIRVGLHYPEVSADPALSVALLDLDVDDRFDVINPKNTETPDTITQIARGYTEVIRPFEHSIAINAAPASPYATVVLDASTAKLSTDSSTLSAGITSTATSLSVATPSGTLWKTGAVSIPVTVGGETMTVTNISGTSSPQTFTATRSLNGIIKAHGSGAVVALTRKPILAL